MTAATLPAVAVCAWAALALLVLAPRCVEGASDFLARRDSQNESQQLNRSSGYPSSTKAENLTDMSDADHPVDPAEAKYHMEEAEEMDEEDEQDLDFEEALEEQGNHTEYRSVIDNISHNLIGFSINRRRREDGNCLYKKAREAVGKWQGSAKNKYQYGPIPKTNPSKFVTDCSGFVGWVLTYGKAPCGQALYKEFLQKGKRSTSGKVFAKDFYWAIDRQTSRKWDKISEAKNILPGDILVYRIVDDRGYPVHGSGIDSGHIFIALRKPKPAFDECQYGDWAGKVKRYKLEIADATKKAHYKPDTRITNGCKKDCGIGKGYLYLYVKKSDDKLVAVSNGFPASVSRGREAEHFTCPPAKNVKRHQYTIGRIAE